MSDYEALLHFNRRPISTDMIRFLVSTTASIIKIKEGRTAPISLVAFIQGLITHSNVQTPTLMSTVVYLTRLRSIIPSDVYGIETTRHRIFLGCLILAAKNLNDSSPLNIHWATYTNGLLNINEVNTIERELLEYFDWKLKIGTNDLIVCLSHFLKPIREKLIQKDENALFNVPAMSDAKKIILNKRGYSKSSSNVSIPSLSSSSTINSVSTTSSRKTQKSLMSTYKMNIINEEINKNYSSNNGISPLTKPIILNSHISEEFNFEKIS